MFFLIFILFVAYVIYFYINEFKERKKAPPGLWPLPILGNMLDLARASSTPHLAIAKLAESYEDIFRIKTGPKDLVVLTSIDAIQTILSLDNAAGRDLCGSFLERNLGKSIGIILSQGKVHQQIKAWAVRNLRDYGFGKSSSMERIINQELQITVDAIEQAIESNKGIMQIQHAFILQVFKVAWQMIQGQSTPEDDEMIKRLIFKSEAMAANGILGTGIVNCFPFLRFIFPNLTGHNIQMEFYKDCHQTAKELLQASKINLQGKKTAENFIESYAQKMEEESNNPQTNFNEEQFQVLFMDILQASSDTTSSFLECCMLDSVLHPDVQSKIYEEIQRFIPEDRDVQSSDKNEMIYTQAFFHETHRHARIAQNLMPRTALQDIQYKTFLIKKGTTIIADITTANNCSKLWNDPELFLPERFIGENSQLINQNKIVPFGNGKRLCPGESLAFATYFLFYVKIIRKYRLSQVPRQNPPRADLNSNITSKPFPFQILFSKRTAF